MTATGNVITFEDDVCNVYSCLSVTKQYGRLPKTYGQAMMFLRLESCKRCLTAFSESRDDHAGEKYVAVLLIVSVEVFIRLALLLR